MTREYKEYRVEEARELVKELLPKADVFDLAFFLKRVDGLHTTYNAEFTNVCGIGGWVILAVRDGNEAE